MVESQCKCKCLQMSAQAFQSYENDFIFRKSNFTNNNNFCQSRKANITIYYFWVFSLLILHLFSLLASTPWKILVWIKTMFLKVYYVGILTFPTRMLGIIKILVRLDHVASKFQQFDVQTFTVHSKLHVQHESMGALIHRIFQQLMLLKIPASWDASALIWKRKGKRKHDEVNPLLNALSWKGHILCLLITYRPEGDTVCDSVWRSWDGYSSHVLRKERETGHGHNRSTLYGIFLFETVIKTRIKACSNFMGDYLGQRVFYKLSLHIHNYIASN